MLTEDMSVHEVQPVVAVSRRFVCGCAGGEIERMGRETRSSGWRMGEHHDSRNQ